MINTKQCITIFKRPPIQGVDGYSLWVQENPLPKEPKIKLLSDSSIPPFEVPVTFWWNFQGRIWSGTEAAPHYSVSRLSNEGDGEAEQASRENGCFLGNEVVKTFIYPFSKIHIYIYMCVCIYMNVMCGQSVRTLRFFKFRWVSLFHDRNMETIHI